MAAAKVACVALHTRKLLALTEDNGKEHADHLQLEQVLDNQGYFIRSYAPWHE